MVELGEGGIGGDEEWGRKKKEERRRKKKGKEKKIIGIISVLSKNLRGAGYQASIYDN